MPQFKALGGIVQPLYAASGMFTPKGTDTVPAMLTPGELVVDADTTKRLQGLVGARSGGGGRTEALLDRIATLLEQRQNINVNAKVVDERKVVTREQMEGREGERWTMWHVQRNK